MDARDLRTISILGLIAFLWFWFAVSIILLTANSDETPALTLWSVVFPVLFTLGPIVLALAVLRRIWNHPDDRVLPGDYDE
jgi:hypothetical protein